MALDLVTGYRGEDHVTAEQVADFQRGIYGEAAILDVGSKMAVQVQTANQLTVMDGIAVFDGRQISIGYGESVNIPITSGTQGMVRNDLVVVQYTRNESSGIESVAFQVIEGTPNASTAVDPTYTDLDIRSGVLTSQKAFARVKIIGTAIDKIEMMVGIVKPLSYALTELANIFNGETNVIIASDES